LDDKGNQTVTINDNLDSEIEGTIFSLSMDCKINGASDTGAFRSQTICFLVKVTGGGDFHVTYDPEDNYQEVMPPKIEVKKSACGQFGQRMCIW
jgi:hypothetical protein